jgi:hypothetical protein
MATFVLTSAASAAGLSGLAGTALGLGAAVVGSVIDRRLFGAGGAMRRRTEEGPRLSGFHITASTEGAPINRLWGRSRLGGQMIWATRFKETAKTTTSSTTSSTSGGKGGGGQSATTTTTTTTYQYACSFAIAFCEGKAAALGRVWADGKELELSKFAYRFHRGTETQAPDAFIETIEGAGNVPAYRGICYLVFEEMPLEAFGNRIPQISAEIIKPIITDDVEGLISAVTLIPASGEFVYATSIHVKTDNSQDAFGENMHNAAGEADFTVSLDQLGAICPNVGAVLLVVAWFGDDLRSGSCTIRPRVEVASKTVTPADWRVNGVARSGALTVSVDGDGRPVYGGTPSDHVVVEAIQELKARGHQVIFYPFILMDIPAGNGLADPYGGPEQGAFPWRGRITCDPAPGEPGTPDKTAAAGAQVDAFFGAAAAGDFTVTGEEVDWSGSSGEWGYRRMALHYAHLCEAAGGVDGFVIASELVGLTGVRSSVSAYPAVSELTTLAGDIAGVLAAATKLTYAADWSEYHSHRPDDGSGDVHFNLDPLWASADINAVGIDNYLPLADWRDGVGHLDYDAANGPTSTYDLAYLEANIEGGEHFDWFYTDQAAREAQTRTTIADAAYAKPWVFRNKDIRGWWLNQHFDRPGGVESGSPTAWTGEGKPVWFTEFGCPAVDKGANQPNVFHDPKSSESAFPHHSSGRRDDLIQRRYLEAHLRHWDPAGGNNPISSVYSGPMIDTSRMLAWTWDARPFPDFPYRASVWTDAGNYSVGHWLNGRLGQVSLAVLVREICALVGLANVDVTGLYGINTTVTGFVADEVMTPRAMLETLMQAFQFDAFESAGTVRFTLSGQPAALSLAEDDLVIDDEEGSPYAVTRAQETELPRVVRITYIDPDQAYGPGAAEGRKLVGNSSNIAELKLPVVLAQDYARGLADTIVQNAWINRESATVALPPSRLALDPGDVVDITMGGRARAMQIDRISAAAARTVELTAMGDRVPGEVAEATGREARIGPVTLYGPSTLEFMDLPLLPGLSREPQAPRLAAHQLPWPGAVAVYRAQPGGGYRLVNTVTDQAVMGELTAPLGPGPLWRWDLKNEIEVELYTSALASSDAQSVLAGGNTLAIGNEDGGWEIIQYVTAELIGARRYRLARLLRGQLGTESEMRDPVAAGARVVLIDANALQSLDLTHDQRLLELTYRYGPAAYGHDHFTYAEATLAFQGVGLRPLSPARVKAVRPVAGSDIALSWVRRGRVGGDSWEQTEVALGEESEAYDVEIMDGGAVIRTFATTAPAVTYTAAEQTADWGAPIVAPASLSLRIYQKSVTFGRGVALGRTLSFPLAVET